MKAFYILTIKHLPCTNFKPHRIKVSCNGSSKIYSNGIIDEYIYHNKTLDDAETVSAKMFINDLMNEEFLHPEEKAQYKFEFIGYGCTDSGRVFIVDRVRVMA